MCKEGGCCSFERCGKCYLVTLNSMMVVAGFVLIVLSIWLGVLYKGYGEIVSATLVWTPLGVGLGVLFMALLGCCGIMFKNKVSLVLYSVICMLLMLAATLLGIFLLVEIGYIKKAGSASDSNDLTNEGALVATTFESVVFNRCCYNAIKGWGDYKVGLCPCTTDTDAGCTCFKDQDDYDFQNDSFDAEFCDVLSEVGVVYNNAYVNIVDDPAKGGCGGGDPKVFQLVISEYATTKLAPGAWGIFATGLVLLLGVILACCVICQRPSAKDKGYERQPANERARGRDEVNLDKPIDLDDQGVELQQRGDKVTFA